jgi:hypothetical protein
MLLANSYGLFDPSFFASLDGYDLLLADYAILNAVIKSENEAQEAMMKQRKDQSDHPGMERYQTQDEFWDEVERAGRGKD